MRVFGVAALSAVLIGTAGLATPARAQSETPHVNLLSDKPTMIQEQIEAFQAKEKPYMESLRNIPDAKVSNDPWGGVRSDAPKATPAAKDSTKTSTKTSSKTSSAKAKTKTGSN
jgi:hypothetical protein